jgi:hypothetical protein
VLFVNSQGFKVRVLPEQEQEGPKDDPPPPPRRQFDDKDEDIEESKGEGWDGRRGKHNRKIKEPASSTSEPKRKSVPLDPSEQAAKLPDSAMNQYGSNLTDSGDIFPALAKIVSAAATKQASPQRSGESGEMVESDGKPTTNLAVPCD